MSGWSYLLESEFLEKTQGGTTKTYVSPVHSKGVNHKKEGGSPVLGVRSRGILKKRTFLHEEQKGQEGNINDAGQNITIEKDRLNGQLIDERKYPLAKVNIENKSQINNLRKPLVKNLQSSNLSRPKMRAVTHPEQQLRDRVMAAAMRVCDYWGDGEEAREDMKQEIKALPHEQLRAMLLHFRESYKGLIGSSSDKGRKQHE